MNNTAGLVLDLYDAPQDLRTIFPSMDVVPEMVKSAQVLSSEMRDALPDDVFALVLMNGEGRLRKYACVDEGNTTLSIAYFIKHGHKLPDAAQKTAAMNLITACQWYGMDIPPQLEKIALSVNKALTLATAPAQVKGAVGSMKGNLAATKAVGNSVITPRDQHSFGQMLKSAEVSGTSLAPNQDDGDLTTAGARGKPGSSNTSAMKSAAAGHLVEGHRGDVAAELETTRGAAGEQYESAPQAAPLTMKPHVGVTNKEPPKKITEKEAQHYAYRNVFPLDNYSQVVAASQYFDKNAGVMDPEMRRVFAVNMVPRASAMGIPFSKLAADCSSSTFAPEEQMKIALDTRRPFLLEKQAAALDTLYSHRAELGPDLYRESLAEFDKLAEIDWRYDSAVVDPFAATFGIQKTAEDEGDSWISGNDYVTRRQIANYSVTAGITLADDYGPDFKREFMKDPWGIFQSLPLDQKKRMARAASDNGATGLHDVQ